MKKVLLRFYGSNNLGDDLFVAILTKRYINHFSLIMTIKNNTLNNIDNLKLYKNRTIYILYRLIEKLFNVSNLWAKKISKKNDLQVYVGGSLFIEGNDPSRWKQEESNYRKSHIPYYILGSNFGPYKSAWFVETVENILKGAEDVCFRDNASYEVFKGLDNTRLSTDIAFSLDISKYHLANEKMVIFSIIDCSRRFSEDIAEKYNQEIINMSKKLLKDGYEVVFMSFCKYEGDEAAIERIMTRMGTALAERIKTFKYDGNLDEALGLMAKSEIIVAGRFHAAILGLLFSKKIVPMAYSDKTINILKDINFTGKVIDIRNIDKFDGSKFDFDTIPATNISKQVKLAETQFQVLDKVLVRRK